MTVEVFPSERSTPQQVFLEVEDEISKMEHVAIVYMRRGEVNPRLYCSSMLPRDLHFLGAGLQRHAFKDLKD